VERQQEIAFRAAYLILHDAAAAEDVAQEAFVRAYRGLGGFRHGEAFRPWLLRIVTNLALNESRARKRRGALAERYAAVATAGPAPSPEEAVAHGFESVTVTAAMARLDDKDRLVLYLRYFLELGEREMAVTLNIPAGTVKSRLSRAGRRLREFIERCYPQLRDDE
jgi:RNA polymerase sigma-70 factor (ECF subfamily)